WLVGLDISPYAFAHARNHEPRRARRLLAHKQEILRLDARTREKGLTLIPTELYLKNGRVKVEIAVARGKPEYDNRETERKREDERGVEAASGRRRGGGRGCSSGVRARTSRRQPSTSTRPTGCSGDASRGAPSCAIRRRRGRPESKAWWLRACASRRT